MKIQKDIEKNNFPKNNCEFQALSGVPIDKTLDELVSKGIDKRDFDLKSCLFESEIKTSKTSTKHIEDIKNISGAIGNNEYKVMICT